MSPFDNLKDGIDTARALQAQAVAKGAPAVPGALDATEPPAPDAAAVAPREADPTVPTDPTPASGT